MKDVVWNLQNIKKEVKNLDKKLKVNSEDFKIAVILLSALIVGANNKKIIDFTKYSEKLVNKVSKNMRRNKIWKREKTCCDWFNEKDGGIAFWCDVAVAKGYLARSNE